jgi:hypothetical protein
MTEPTPISVTAEDAPTTGRVWYRTTLYNAFVIGSVGFLAPGLWNAMNSLGAGGAETPYLVNAANALVFGLSRLSKSKSSSKAPERFRLTLMF